MRSISKISLIVLFITVWSNVSGQLAWLTNVAGGGNGANQNALDIGLRVNSLAIDSKANLFVADHTSNIKRIDAQTKLVSILNIATSQAVFLFIDGADNLFVADQQFHTVKKFSLETGEGILIAGIGENGFGGDGSLAINAKLSKPSGVITDGAGNIFIIDSGNNRVRKVDAAGIITTVAGNGFAGFSGDGGQAINAMLNNPLAIAKDADNNLYIADYQNNRIRKIDLGSGLITTIAGLGPGAYNGDDKPAVEAMLNFPAGLYFDGNNLLYVSDRFNRRVRKINLTTGFISLVAGNGNTGSTGDGGQASDATLVVPGPIVADKQNNLYIGDDWEFGSNGIIRKISLSTGTISLVAGNKGRGFCCEGIPARQAQFVNIAGVAADANNNIYIADADGYRIRKLSQDGVVTTIAGNGLLGSSGDGGDARQAELMIPQDIAIDNAGNIFVSEAYRIRKISPDNIIRTTAGGSTAGTSGDNGPATDALLENSHGLHVDKNGNIYVAQYSKVRMIDGATGIITTIAGGGTGGDGGLATDAQLDNIADITVDSIGTLFIAQSSGRVRKVAAETGVITTIAGNGTMGFNGDGGLATNAQLSGLSAIAVDRYSNIYIGDGPRVRQITPNGLIKTIAGIGGYGSADDFFATLVPLERTSGFVFDSNNNILISGSQRIKKLYQNKLDQSISFGELPTKTFGNQPFNISATSSTGLPVTFTSSDQDVATIDGTVVTITGAGVSTISATQAGDFIYKPVTVTRQLMVNKASQVLTFENVSQKTFGDPAFQVHATASSGLSITFSTTASNVTLASNTVTLTSAGLAHITASQTGDKNYHAASPVTNSFCVNPPKPTIASAIGATTTLTSSNPTGNQWYRNGSLMQGATLNTLQVTEEGDYTVITSVDECSSLPSDKLKILITGIETSGVTNLIVYPNPASEMIKTNIVNTPHTRVKITNINGIPQQVTQEIQSETIEINIKGLSNGIYFLTIQSGTMSLREKIIKN